MKTFNPEGMIKKHSFPYYPNHFIQQIVRECSAGYQEKYRDCRWDKRFENVRIRGWIGHNGEQCCDCLKNYEILQDATIKLMEDLYSLAMEYKNKDDVDNLLIDQGKMFCNDIIKTLEEFKV